jgi:cytochrome c peroxidase
MRRLLRALAAGVVAWTATAWIGGGNLLAEQSGNVSDSAWRKAFAPQPAIPYPQADPYSDAKAALGAALFFDPILSGSHTMSCESCHKPEMGWADHRSRAVGDKHEPMALRSPTLIGVAWAERLGWDGKFDDVEAVALRAMTTPGNMDLPVQEALDRLAANPAYVRRFTAVFGQGGITEAHLAQALATYVRSITTPPAPFDRWVAGDDAAVSAAAKRGFALFTGKAGCANCHSGPSFTDYSFQDVGIGKGDDIGRGRLFPTSKSLRYAFKVPSLRDAALRAPYMHDGSLPTLEAVINEYDQGGIDRPSRSSKIRPLGLSPDEKSDLLAFLETLTSERQTIVVPMSPH